ncbi:hypothetical protein BUALT_Bualt13G0000700 [Buddleja alternifolia]|uniref:Histone-lysine N-methyltransferase CLF-like HTH domain-containing protein n=1 Tax=Buddleja alternifolia TaxID=168488 RepID=A0AAV6WIN0_9LAMI|nr:hypothetical protein BUALT_Bualt13G0000700 [Buddleja alternifolia]
MVSKSSLSASKFRKSHWEQGSDNMANFNCKFTQLKRQIQAERVVSIGGKLEENSNRIQSYVSDLEKLAASRNDFTVTRIDSSENFLSFRMDNPLYRFSGLTQGFADRDDINSEEVVFSTSAKLPPVERMPPFTTWIFLDRNQRMADDQSVVGRRRIYYDQHGSEALICSDSEEEHGELEGLKHEFSEGEDRILRVAFQECGIGDEVLNSLTQFVRGTSSEIQERCDMLREKDQTIDKQNLKSSGEAGSEDNVILNKSLSAALDSFDNLFCRRCLVFDCRLHGCSQNLIYPSEKQSNLFDPEEDRKPCGDQCYLWLNGLKDLIKSSAAPLDESQSKVSDDEDMNLFSPYAKEQVQNLESKRKHGIFEPTNSLTKSSRVVSDDLLSSSSKKLKLAVQNALDLSTALVDQFPESNEYEFQISTSSSVQDFHKHGVDALDCSVDVSGDKVRDAVQDKGKDIAELPLEKACESSNRWREWKPLEKDLYLKGLEIFGRNSCLIARSMLPGLKTCKEVSSYMYGDGAVMARGSSAILRSFFEDVGKADMGYMEADMGVKSRVCRKRGRARKVKSSWKSAGHPSLWRRIADGKDQPFKQYAPCICQSACGKQCPCLLNGTCCARKVAKTGLEDATVLKVNAKAGNALVLQLDVNVTQMFAEIVGLGIEFCGDGSSGEPPRRGDGQCGNMRLLLRQQQRILLAKSDVAGWGAFLKNSVNKNDYLGEYTGELISHREADKRGKIYDRANSSFLFDLNDQARNF